MPLVTCEDVREALSASVDGEVSSLERYTLESHLGTCAGCAQVARSFGQLHARLAAVPRLVAPADLRARVQALARGEDAPFAAPAAGGRAGWFAFLPRQLRSPAVGLALIMVVAVGGFLHSSGMLLPGNLRTVVAEHLAYHPGDVSTAATAIADVGDALRTTVAAFAPFVASPQVDGAFLDGRVARVEKEDAAHFSFTDQDGRPLSLFVMPADCQTGDWGTEVRHHGSDYKVASYRGHTIVSWRQKGAVCVLLCPTTDHELLEQAHRVQSGFETQPS